MSGVKSASTFPLTLADVFKDASTRRNVDGYIEKKDYDRLRLVTRGAKLGMGDVEQEIDNAVSRSLDVRLIDVFAGGWSKLKEIADYADIRKYPRGHPNVVPLASHQITSHHTPTVEVMVDDVTVLRLQLDVSLEAHFEALVLTIDGGAIRTLRSGGWLATGAVSCNGTQIRSVRSRKFAFPGELRFDPPAQIAGRGLAAAAPADQRRPGAQVARDGRSPAAAGGSAWALSGFDETGGVIRLVFSPGSEGAEQSWVLGRNGERADCVIKHRSVSSRHARIRCRPGHALEICDLGSSNGSKVDGRTLSGEYVSLEGAKKVVLGGVEMTLNRV